MFGAETSAILRANNIAVKLGSKVNQAERNKTPVKSRICKRTKQAMVLIKISV